MYWREQPCWGCFTWFVHGCSTCLNCSVLENTVNRIAFEIIVQIILTLWSTWPNIYILCSRVLLQLTNLLAFTVFAFMLFNPELTVAYDQQYVYASQPENDSADAAYDTYAWRKDFTSGTMIKTLQPLMSYQKHICSISTVFYHFIPWIMSHFCFRWYLCGYFGHSWLAIYFWTSCNRNKKGIACKISFVQHI